MNSIASRLKAIAVTAIAFAASSFCLLGLTWLLAMVVPDAAGGIALSAYGPHSSIAALTDLRAVSALAAAFLVMIGLVLVIDSAYCDRMTAILADVLLMVLAAIAGFVAGYWVLLRLAGYSNFLDGAFLQSAIISPVVVFLASLLPLTRIRAILPVRLATILILLAAGPAMLALGS